MSVDVFQDKIRKTKNPSVMVLEAFPGWVPPAFAGDQGIADDLARYYGQLLSAMKGIVPAVRFGFGSFALLGGEGLSALKLLAQQARSLDYYILLDLPELLSVSAAENAALVLADEVIPFDGLVFSGYLGSDIYNALLPVCRKGKALFPVIRTSNKSAPQLQDLLTGTRLVHTAAADIVIRSGESFVGKYGYSQVGVLAAASAADSLRALRGKYPRLFLLLDGYDYPNANAKNCSFAFDKLGHGAAACAGNSLAAAWKEQDNEDPLQAAVSAAQRMKKNLVRYINVL